MTPRELREACPPGGGPYACPCCKLPTLAARARWEMCHECNWEDDGQDDLNADEVWGGPNGAESLTDARLSYAQYVATTRATDPNSFEACPRNRASRGYPARFAASPDSEAMPDTAVQTDRSTSSDPAR